MSRYLSLRLIVGVIVVAVGLTGLVVATQYEFGLARRLGPGYFPMVLSALLVGLGGAETVAALFDKAARSDQPIADQPIAWRPVLAILAAVAGFALSVSSLGLIPAVLVCVGLTSLAEPDFGILPAAVIAGATSLAAWALFSLLLGMTLPLIRFGF